MIIYVPGKNSNIFLIFYISFAVLPVPDGYFVVYRLWWLNKNKMPGPGIAGTGMENRWFIRRR
jgi:hypothetical protein